MNPPLLLAVMLPLLVKEDVLMVMFPPVPVAERIVTLVIFTLDPAELAVITTVPPLPDPAASALVLPFNCKIPAAPVPAVSVILAPLLLEPCADRFNEPPSIIKLRPDDKVIAPPLPEVAPPVV